jgi:ribosomal protein S26
MDNCPNPECGGHYNHHYTQCFDCGKAVGKSEERAIIGDILDNTFLDEVSDAIIILKRGELPKPSNLT